MVYTMMGHQHSFPLLTLHSVSQSHCPINFTYLTNFHTILACASTLLSVLHALTYLKLRTKLSGKHCCPHLTFGETEM